MIESTTPIAQNTSLHYRNPKKPGSGDETPLKQKIGREDIPDSGSSRRNRAAEAYQVAPDAPEKKSSPVSNEEKNALLGVPFPSPFKFSILG